MKLIDNLLNKVNMYMLTLINLDNVIILAVVLSAFDVLPYSPWRIVGSALFLVIACAGFNALFAKAVKTTPNTQSAFITALILSLIVGPVSPLNNWLLLIGLSALAMASKYLLVWRGKHIFNPAALAVVASAIFFNYGASWWVSSVYLLPIIVLPGIFLLRKINRLGMVAVFLAAYALLTLAFQPDVESLWRALAYSPVVFFAFIMLTEPQTSPKRESARRWYALAVAAILVVMQQYLTIAYTMELALLVGNVFVFALGRDIRTRLEFTRSELLADGIHGFWFKPKRKFNFEAGQYLEATASHGKQDSRGIRRYFTIASSPTENELLLAMRIPDPRSSFKQAMLNLKPGQNIIMTGPEGDFVLPKDEKQKIVFVAGGVGITPFRSIVKFLSDTQARRDIVLLYAANNESEFAFRDVFQTNGLRTVYWPSGGRGQLDAEIIKQQVPDWSERTFYLSGPEPMVKALQKTLAKAGIGRQKIKHDYFPGYEQI